MRVKKFLQLSAAAAALTLTFTMGATAWADWAVIGDENSENTSITIVSSVMQGSRTTLSRIRTVQVSMGNTELTYTPDVAEVWNEEEFDVELRDNGSTWDEQSLSITNGSEIGVSVTVECTSTDSSIVELQVDGKTKKDDRVQPDGTLNVKISAETKDLGKLLEQGSSDNIGTVTVTLK